MFSTTYVEVRRIESFVQLSPAAVYYIRSVQDTVVSQRHVCIRTRTTDQIIMILIMTLGPVTLLHLLSSPILINIYTIYVRREQGTEIQMSTYTHLYLLTYSPSRTPTIDSIFKKL